MTQTKIYSAVFKGEDAGGADPYERVEYFCEKDLNLDGEQHEPSEYATEFLMAEGEYLDEILEEDAITDADEIQGILEEVLEYVRLMTENGADDREVDMRQRLEKLLVSHVATN